MAIDNKSCVKHDYLMVLFFIRNTEPFGQAYLHVRGHNKAL